MKKIIVIVAALTALLCSCQKESVVSPRDVQVSSDGSAILFGVKCAGISSPVTRAITPNVLSSLDGGFKVAALKEDNLEEFYFDTLAIKKSDKIFGVDNYYWPIEGALSFYGVFPKTGYSFTNNSGIVSFPVGTSSAQFDAQTDILAARNLAVTNPNASKDNADTVGLDFGHILHWLSALTFTAGDANAKFKLKSVSLDAPGYGSYTFSADSLGAWGSLPDSASFKNYELYKNAEGLEIKPEGTSVSGLTDMMVIAAGKCYLRVQYTVSINGAEQTYDKTAKINLWQGKKSTVKATLTNDLTPIIFEVSVKDWEDEEINADLTE